MRNKFLGLLFNIIIYGLPIYFVVSLYLYYSSMNPKKNIIKTVGCVNGRTTGRGPKSDIVEFNYKGKIYKAETGLDSENGEKFIVEFEKDNPSINKVNDYEPVFLKGEEVSFAIGYLNTYNTNCFKSLSFYTYYVDGNKYEKFFTPLENSDLKYPNAKEGYNYIVKYWNFNPQRSVILLDKKTDKSLYDIK